MKQQKRYLTFLLALAMCLTLLAGCGGSTNEQAGQSAEISATVTSEAAPEGGGANETTTAAMTAEDAYAVTMSYLPLAETTDFTIWSTFPPFLYNMLPDGPASSIIWDILEEKANATFTFQVASTETGSESFNLMIAGGDYPDIMVNVATYYNGGLEQGVEDEVFRDLLEYVPSMPTLSARIAENPAYLNLSTSGYLTSFQTLMAVQPLPDTGPVIRQDWLDELNMEVPVTYDELHDVLVAFKTTMGATDALWLPSSGCANWLGYGLGVDVTFNQMGDPFYMVDGTIKFAPLEDGFENYIELVRQWYSEGLIMNDYISYTESFQMPPQDYVTSGKMGVFGTEVGKLTTYEGLTDGTASFIGMAAPKVNATDVDHFSGISPYAQIGAPGWTVSTQCENMDALIQVADYMYTDEFSMYCNYGIEGQSYVIDDSGKITFTDLITNNPDGLEVNFAFIKYALGTSDADPYMKDGSRILAGYTENQAETARTWAEGEADYKLPIDLALTADEQSESTAIYSDIKTYLAENISKLITGNLSMDEYDTFVQGIYNMNIDRVIEIRQGALDRYLAQYA